MLNYCGIFHPKGLSDFLAQLNYSFSLFIPNVFQNLRYSGQIIYTSELYNPLDAIFVVNSGN